MGPIELLISASEELRLVDVGARWGVHKRWDAILAHSKVLCFEPDIQECKNLQASSPNNIYYQPIALSDHWGELDIFITEQPACSSAYPPVSSLYQLFPSLKDITPRSVARVSCRPLDDIVSDLQWDRIDCIKLDIQGYELNALKGANNALENCSIVDIEVEFNTLYEGQPLFFEVDGYLRKHGFVLWKLENLSHYAPEIVPAAESSFFISAEPYSPFFGKIPAGQLFWAQAQYVRASYPPSRIDPLFRPQAIRAALLAGCYGFWDLSLEVLKKSGDIELVSELRKTLGMSTP
ncbi:FkbM family methyltransferase [Methylocystis sp. JR02]|uniref:FkbM family methyltransferase n=1 Tax=Methylocystis sp. JR02 TaxID=3046284 RepID=UPI0024BAA1A7|nr:FkbM family methyltransferase [Methylocystis sp. JR02]MDJ0448030.1 FkbM family methyltransferase [Methylocystis sp. JR02]